MKRIMWPVALLGTLALTVVACGEGGTQEPGSGGGGGGNLSGEIRIDGSSTVFPYAQAAAEMFQNQNPNVRVTVGQSGTGGGFEKFCAGESDISDASRPIEQEEEEACRQEGIDYEEIQVARDGITVAINPALGIPCMTVDDLERLWRPDSNVDNYRQLGPRYPDAEASLYGPGTDSGTFEFFTEAIVGEEGASRDDYQASEDDSVLVQGIRGDDGGLGYFGYSYFAANQEGLNAVAIDAGEGCVQPSVETIQSGEYAPLSRPLFFYPSERALSRPEVEAFLQFVAENSAQIAEAAQLVPMSQQQQQETREKVSRLVSQGQASEGGGGGQGQ